MQGRAVVMGTSGMVATGHSLASVAGLEVLTAGGNALDAALTAAGVLGVVQPMMSGLGGDSFLLYHDAGAGRTWAVNGSGPAPEALSLDSLAGRSGGMLPSRGMLSAGVPGAVDVLCTSLERWGSGRFGLPEILAPAIRYARDGFPVGQAVGSFWEAARDVLAGFETSRAALLPNGKAPHAGDLVRFPAYAASLEQVAAGGRDAFYRGPIGREMARYSQEHGGALDERDLDGYSCEILEPLAVSYRDWTVLTTPPPSQGIILLEEMALLAGDNLGNRPRQAASTIHLMAEAKKLAFADRNAYLADPAFQTNPIATLLSPTYIARRRQDIDPMRAQERVPPGALLERGGETTFLCAADEDGNMVSLITSLSAAFGCGEVAGATGILLNNRVGRGFSTDPTSPNVLAPGKRTMHTLFPYLVMAGAHPVIVGGTPGGDGQPQINLQVLSNMLEWDMNVQEAVEAPRWMSVPGTDPSSLALPFELRLEPGFPEETAAGLVALGHRVVQIGPVPGTGAQVIRLDRENGVYHGGSDPRVDGCAVGF